MTALLEARNLTKAFTTGLLARRSTTALLDFSLTIDSEPPSITERARLVSTRADGWGPKRASTPSLAIRASDSEGSSLASTAR